MVKIILIFIALIYIYAFLNNLSVSKTSNAKNFSKGTAPHNLSGFHKGSAGNQETWLGKKFDPDSSSGINEFKDGEKYSFKTSISGSSLKLNYNQPGNPLWIKFIQDEIVETDKNYLGRIQVLLPIFPITIGFFTLEK